MLWNSTITVRPVNLTMRKSKKGKNSWNAVTSHNYWRRSPESSLKSPHESKAWLPLWRRRADDENWKNSYFTYLGKFFLQEIYIKFATENVS